MNHFRNTTNHDAAKHEPLPKPGKVDIYPLVLADIQARADAGRAKYGTVLQSHNGRDALMDAYQEAIDLALYLRQAMVEREMDARNASEQKETG